MKRKIKYLLYRLKWLLSPYINFSTPVHIDLELSTKCNLNCEFCFRQEYKYKQQDINIKVLERVLLEIEKWNILSVKFNWRGEAVLNPSFYRLAKSLQFQGIFTELNTSLSKKLTNERLWQIANYIDRLSISIDSNIPDIYEQIRKGASYYYTFNNLMLLYYYREREKMPAIIINRRTSQLTESESDEQFKQKFFDNGMTNLKFDIKPAQARNAKDIYTKQNKKNKYCGQPSQRMVIGVDGKVWMCCHAYKESIGLYLGNLKYETLQEIWNKNMRKQKIHQLKMGMYTDDCIFCPLGGDE